MLIHPLDSPPLHAPFSTLLKHLCFTLNDPSRRGGPGRNLSVERPSVFGRIVQRFPHLLLLWLLCGLPLQAQRPVGNPHRPSLRPQPYQRAEACLPCHRRQYDELRSSVKSGYRSVSSVFNALELSGNFLSGGRLRPVYGDSDKVTAIDVTGVAGQGKPLNTNMNSADTFTHINQVQAAFCIGCHAPHIVLMGEDPDQREIPELEAVGGKFRPDLIRPLRDFHFVDSSNRQVLPEEIGGPPPPGARPSLGAQGINCDVCHDITAPDLDRSPNRDGLANSSFELIPTISKIGPFLFPAPVKNNFHFASSDPDQIGYLRSSDFCGSCHDVRVPGDGSGSLTHREISLNPESRSVSLFRLENLNTEWMTGPYNSTQNPFGRVIRCQDCHMSLFPYGRESTYQVGELEVTSPTPGQFPLNFAAVPGISTDRNYPLQQRPVVTHYMTGVDVPILRTAELRARLGQDYPDVDEPGTDEYGIPLSLAQRREDLLKASVRISLDKSDRTAKPGRPLMVKVTAVALTGHRFPAGFSQERTAYIQLSIRDNRGFLLYQSGYVVDKPHPEVGEMAPDGNLDDEDPEHLHAVVDPGHPAAVYRVGQFTNGHRNQVFQSGPDNGPDARIFFGRPSGLVLWRNELTRVFLPGESLGRFNEQGDPIRLTRPHMEETFSAVLANSVDNYRSLPPLQPRTYAYEVELPTREELQLLGAGELESPLHVQAQVNFLHFPPLFMRFMARTTSAEGPGGRDYHLIDEKLIDDLLVNVRGIASADFTIDLEAP